MTMAEQITDSHINKLNRRVSEVRDACASQGDAEDFDSIIDIMRKPGWTTLPEVALIHALLDATERTASQLRELRTSLRAGVVAVDEGSAGEM
jgi:hypothetical protein